MGYLMYMYHLCTWILFLVIFDITIIDDTSDTSSLVHSFSLSANNSRQRAFISTKNPLFAIDTNSDNNNNNNSERYEDGTDKFSSTGMKVMKIHLVATNDIILLPGETTVITLNDDESIPLIQDCLSWNNDCDDCGSARLALGVNLVTSSSSCDQQQYEYEEHEISSNNHDEHQIAQVASLCNIVGLVANTQDRVEVNLKCIGRIRVMEMIQQYTSKHFQCTANWIQESLEKDELQKALLIEENINILIHKISTLEQQLKDRNLVETENVRIEHSANEKDPTPLSELYTRTREKVSTALVNDFQQQYKKNYLSSQSSQEEVTKVQRLVAASWAVFMSLNNEFLETKYRLRALDWDNLLERLKLAQYVLREKELLLQGHFLLHEEKDVPAYSSDYSDAFQ